MEQTFAHWLDCSDLASILHQGEDELSSICRANGILPTSFKRRGLVREALSGLQVRSTLELAGLQFPKKAQRLSFMMCKGGVGKTTVSYFLGRRLASYGARVLIIDSDPQGNMTGALRPDLHGFSLSDRSAVLVDVIAERCKLKDAILPLTSHLHLLPSSSINSLLERELLLSSGGAKPPVEKLNQLLRSVESLYDYILIDCAPSLNVINASIIYASDFVIVPFQLDEFSRLGLQQTVSEVADLENEFSFKTTLRLLLNKFNVNERLNFPYLGDVREKHSAHLMRSAIRQSDEVKSALALRKDFFFKTNSKAREDFDSLAREVLQTTLLKSLSETEAPGVIRAQH